jgi:hypothetical protein
MHAVPRRSLCRATMVAIGLWLESGLAPAVQASELGVNAYLLGLSIPTGGITPPPGVYFKDTYFLYSGQRDIDGSGTRKLKFEFLANVATLAWFPEFTFFGAAPGFAVTMPVIGTHTKVTTPAGQALLDESANGLGDTELSVILGWHAGEHHWNMNATAFTPTGFNDAIRLVGTGLNRPALDIKGAYTYLGAQTGLEVTGIAGITINGMNNATNYLSGAEFHLEWQFAQHFPSGFYAGFTGFFYQQLTPDSGPGAKDGAFIGQSVAIGPAVGYTLKVGEGTIYLAGRWFHEVQAHNKTRGDAIFASLGFRL